MILGFGIFVRKFFQYGEEIFRGVIGRENEAWKVALYLVKRCCDRTLPEMAEYFGIGNYSTVRWNSNLRWVKTNSSEIGLKGSWLVFANSSP